jgi:hypothetical protein
VAPLIRLRSTRWTGFPSGKSAAIRERGKPAKKGIPGKIRIKIDHQTKPKGEVTMEEILKEIAEWAERKNMEVYDLGETLMISSGVEWRKYTIGIQATADGFRCFTYRPDKEVDDEANVQYRKTIRGVKNYISRFVWKGEPPDIEERIKALLKN